MTRTLGILALLAVVTLVTALYEPNFLLAFNVGNQLRWIGLYGILGIGVAFVIITGGIDLSLGSVVCLIGCLFPYLLTVVGWPLPAALAAALGTSLAIGLIHGLLITRLRLQPFVVTLCGLLVYRGIARWLTADKNQGYGGEFRGLRWLATGEIPLPGTDGYVLPVPFLLLLALAAVAAVLLNQTVFGRYLQALGRNEQAARYSGIHTDRITLAAYVLSSLMAGFGGLLMSFESNSVQPSAFGSAYELYAIAAAVLGGCSLRGGEGSIFGVVLGTALMQILRNSVSMLGVQDQLELAVVGTVILVGVIVDEVARRVAAARRRARAAAET